MFRSLITRIANPFYKLSNTQVIILGNQKSGTTAIAKLLAENTGQSILLDSPLLWEPNLSKIINGRLSLEGVIRKNKYYFARQIIKEPNLTFLYNQLVSIYPDSVKFIFIVRDPRDNIRSILNRINIPGNLDDIGAYAHRFSVHEKALFNKGIIPYSSDHYIEQLAERWLKAVEVYLGAKDDFTLIRYENFNQNKVTAIQELSLKMGFQSKYDISLKVDVQYQPKGDQAISREEFFGIQNLERINKICKISMEELAYAI